MSNASDFVIENGVLKEYTGLGGDVSVPEGVMKIDTFAFLNSSNVTSVTLPETVHSIGNGAFRSCGMKSISLPKSVTSIGEEAFVFCRNLTGITLPESIKRIERGAFLGCSSLTNIKLPESIQTISPGLFEDCANLFSITIPQGVNNIDDGAFQGCSCLVSITLPKGLKHIGVNAFAGCSSLEDIALPERMNSIGDGAFQRCGCLVSMAIPAKLEHIGDGGFAGCLKLESVTIPETVKAIGIKAFQGCSTLKSIVLPEIMESIGDFAFAGCVDLESITFPAEISRIGDGAFSNCSGLTSLVLPSEKVKLNPGIFGTKLPKGLIAHIAKLYPHMSDAALKQYVLNENTWRQIETQNKAEIILERSSKSLTAAYSAVIDKEQVAPIGYAILSILRNNPSSKAFTGAANYLMLFNKSIPNALLIDIYDELKNNKKGEKTLQSIEGYLPPINRDNKTSKKSTSGSIIEEKITGLLQNKNQTIKDLEAQLKAYYTLSFKSLPPVNGKDGKPTSPAVLAWLLVAHEQLVDNSVYVAYEHPGLCKDALEVVELLDYGSLQKAISVIADENMGYVGKSKKAFLAYPVCRYADERTMRALTKDANDWENISDFKKACLYSDTKAAMLYSDRYHQLDYYAALRNTTEEELRDKYLSDFGFDADRGRRYDLGNQIVVARLQKDFSVLIELPDGKTTKSLPKKGADPEKYEAANADYSEMKKGIKNALKLRSKALFQDFLSGRERSANDWKNAYLKNPLLSGVGRLLVWSQNNNTFTITDTGTINSNGEKYELSEMPISLAYPTEMDSSDVVNWKEYFVTHGLKQPFLQIWEPVHNAEEIGEDHYKDVSFPYKFFNSADKHGIFADKNFGGGEVNICFSDCDVSFDKTSKQLLMLEILHDNDATVQILRFSFKAFTRKVNHIVSVLDDSLVRSKILENDPSITQFLQGATMAQIKDYLDAALKHNAHNCTAVLLEYKNAHFSDCDDMDEFTLAW